MANWALIIIPALLLVGATLLLGRRDGWLPSFDMRKVGPVRRLRRPLHPREGFAGIVEVMRFAAMRRRAGYETANAIMEALAERIAADPAFEIGRIGRTTIEFYYPALDTDSANRMMEMLKAKLEVTVSCDGVDFEPEVLIGSSPIRSDRLHDELFDLAAFAVDDARALPDRIAFAGDFARLGEPDPAAGMLHDLHEAIRAGALEVYYMPKLRLADGAVVSAEALCRWTHREHGSVPPMVFVRLAEDAGLIGDLTLCVLRRVIADQRRLAQDGFPLMIDVNMSALLVGNARFCDLVIAEIAGAVGPIGIEITETMVIANPETALANLHRFADAGIRIAIDDFGVGLSSLAYLRDLPAQELKIDQMFIRALTTSNRDPLLVRSAIDLAHALEMEVTAEGVEDEIALALLKVMRCDNVQGYHISIPLPYDQLALYLRGKAYSALIEEADMLRGARALLGISPAQIKSA